MAPRPGFNHPGDVNPNPNLNLNSNPRLGLEVDDVRLWDFFQNDRYKLLTGSKKTLEDVVMIKH